MLDLLEIILLLVALLMMIPITVLFIECSSAWFGNLTPFPHQGKAPTKTAILIPAHNEATGIAQTIKTILPQLKPEDHLVIVADNCTDNTATICRQTAAEYEQKLAVTVLERTDLQLRGKGYALDYGLKFLAQDPPEIVILVDADCIVHPGAIEELSTVAFQTGRPIQGNYLQEKPANPSAKDLISTLAILIKNLVRQQGLANLGLPSLLYGTGMAFPWAVISQAPLASGNIVEDMQLGIDLALAGHPPLFYPGAKVTSTLPQQGEAATSQRTRWEHGHLQTLFTQVPKLIKASLQQKRFDLFTLALDLGVPPLSLLVMLWGVCTTFALGVAMVGLTWTPALILASGGLLMVIAIVVSWAKFGRDTIPVSTLWKVPVYLLWKIPLYLAFIFKPQKQWVRTERDNPKSATS